jgi:hypothetical protein
MSALTIIGIILGILLFIGLGIYLWTTSKANYGFNIFGTGVLIRGILSYILMYFSTGAEGQDLQVLWIVIGILWLWTFIITMLRTNIVIAFFSLIYQFIAVVIVKVLIEKILGASED